MDELSTWFRNWFRRHPLKEPAAFDQSRYTAEVMARVRALSLPQTEAARQWVPWPRLALALVTAAVVIIMVGPARQVDRKLSAEVIRDVQLLSALGEPVGDPLATTQEDGLAEELEAMDTLVLAEASPSDDQWVQQTLKLLDQLNEEVEEDPGASDEEWLDELELLDEDEIETTSQAS